MVSVVIPTLNEEERIGSLLCYLGHLDPDLELIVVDGGSLDRTIEQANPYALVIRSERGRAIQMNVGARSASGDVIWFLHADCRPHPASLSAMADVLQNPKVVGGAFVYGLDERGRLFRLSEFFSNLKNRAFTLMYGDMGIFVRAAVFAQIAGYHDVPLMEDMDLCRRLKRAGRVVILPQRMDTSARRWRAEGSLRNIVRNWALQIAWVCGAPPKVLARFYKFETDPRAREACDAGAGRVP